jgi:hypothetical protein
VTDDKKPGDEGFSWGLRPRAAEPVAEPPATEPISPADIPTQAVEQQSPADIPTQAVEQQSPADIPTQAMEQQDLPVDPPTADPSAADQPTEAFAVPQWEPLAVPDPEAPVEHGEPTSAIDSLFAETKFQEYEEVGLIQAITPPLTNAEATGRRAAATPVREHAPFSRRQKVLLWVGIGVVAALALVALFLMGTRIGAGKAVPVTSHSTKAAASTAPKPSATTGPLAPGAYSWKALNGGECIQPFSSPWAGKFTVVDCAKDHHAQLILKGTLPDAASAAYPSAAKLQAEITLLCTAPTALNYATAGAVTDAQIESSYPANEKEWKSGDRTFFCFVTRSSGDALPGNLAVPAAG